MKNNKAKIKRKYPYYNDKEIPKIHPILKIGVEEKNEEIYSEKSINNDNILNENTKI